MTKFLHYRSFDNLPWDKYPQQATADPNNGATVAYQVNEDGKIEYAISWCGPRDNYCKQYGRMKSHGRLNSNKFRQSTDFMTLKEFIDYMDRIMSEQDYYRKQS